MAMSGKIIDLRNLLAIRFPQAPMLVGTRLVTGLASFDQLIGGGLSKREITELISPRGKAGGALLGQAFIHGAHSVKIFWRLSIRAVRSIIFRWPNSFYVWFFW